MRKADGVIQFSLDWLEGKRRNRGEELEQIWKRRKDEEERKERKNREEEEITFTGEWSVHEWRKFLVLSLSLWVAVVSEARNEMKVK